MTALLDVEGLTVEFRARGGSLRAVDDVAFRVREGEVVGIVGESGSGKSVAALAAMGLIVPPGHVSARRLEFDGRDLTGLDAGARRRINGRELAMIFQEPMTSLNPCFTVGFQIMEAIRIHDGGSRRTRRARAGSSAGCRQAAWARIRKPPARLRFSRSSTMASCSSFRRR